MNQNLNTNESIQIDVLKLLKIYRRKFLLILFVSFLGTFLGILFNIGFVEPKFSSTAIIYLNSNEIELQKTILTSRSVLESVALKNNLNISYKEILESLKIDNKNNDRICTITIETKNNFLSKKMVNDIVDYSNVLLQKNFNSSFMIIEYGVESENQSNLSYIDMGIIGGFLFLFLILLYLFFDMNLNEKIESEKEIEIYLDLNVFTSIPKYKKKGLSKK